MELDSNIYSSETEKDTTVNLIIFSFNIKDTLVITSSPPSGNTGGERVALVSGGAGANCSMIDDLAVSVSSTRRVRSLAWVLAPVVKTGSVVWTLAIIEALSSPAGYQGIASVSSTEHQLDDTNKLSGLLTDKCRLVCCCQSCPDLHYTQRPDHRGWGYTETRRLSLTLTLLSWRLSLTP